MQPLTASASVTESKRVVIHALRHVTSDLADAHVEKKGLPLVLASPGL